MSNGLLWWPEEAIGFYPASAEGVYGRSYFDKYVGYAKTEMGLELTRRRIELVSRHAGEATIVDIGIGCGQFIEGRGVRNTFGYDVNPVGIRWLLDREVWWDPYSRDPENASFWDSLEHIRRPGDLLKRIKRIVAVSIPIFHDLDHVLRSKHFRPDEHFWYFTRGGLIACMKRRGFLLLEENWMEAELGREDIGTFVFSRCDR